MLIIRQALILGSLIALIFFFAKTGVSQKIKGERLRDRIDTVQRTKYSDFKLFQFKNINKLQYYSNKKQYEQILKLERKKNWEKLYPALRSYFLNFGIQNFYRDTYWIWRLAKLTEIMGDPQEAKLLYRLVLKHHRADIDISKIEPYYDSLTENERDYYVPLDYYYELVEYRKQVDTLIPPRGVLLNMGNSINSKRGDYGPTLGAGDDILLFTSKRNQRGAGLASVENEDLFITKSYYNVWDFATALKEINTQYNEGSACLSKTGETLFFTRCNSPDSQGNCDLFVAELSEDSIWSNVRNLGTNVNSRGWDSHPSLSHSEDTLFFASDRIGGFGLSDIYYSVKTSSGEWGRANNIGPVINTRNNEVSPFYHPTFDVLYFSSNGELVQFGEFDIFKVHKDGKFWEEPLNIGPLVNGEGAEYYFTIDSKSSNLYYARSEELNMANLDLFSFPLPMEAQPNATTSVRGTLSDPEGNFYSRGIVSIIDLDDGIEVAPKFLRPDGSFEFSLINNKNYLLIIQGEEFFRVEQIFYLDGDAQFNAIAEPISSKIKFESVEFENGKAELKPYMYSDLDKITDFFVDNPEFELVISGHTDSDGSEEFNLQLSLERSQAIREYIVNFGNINPERVTAIGYGSTRPIVKEVTDEDKRLNRRVEFEIYRPSKEELEKRGQ